MKIIRLLFSFLLIALITSTVAYAQIEGVSNLGHSATPKPNGWIIWGGGNTACSDVTGTHVCGMQAPGYLGLMGYASDGTTRIIRYLWFDNSGILRTSSGSITDLTALGDSETNYGIPHSSLGFDYESSGKKVNE